MTSPALSRAQLLNILAHLPEAEWRDAAMAAGFVPRPELPIEFSKPPAQFIGLEGIPPPQEPYWPSDIPDLPFWRIAEEEHLPSPERGQGVPSWLEDTKPWEELPESDPDIPVPRMPDLVPRARRARFLRQQLATGGHGENIDLEKLCRQLAERRFPPRLPRLEHPRWPGEVQLFIDLSPALQPYHGDFWRWAGHLKQILGPRLQLRLCREGQPPAKLPRAGTPLIILGDAGYYSPEGVRHQSWRGFGLHCAREGERPLLLTPCPGRYRVPDLARWFRCVALEQGCRLHLLGHRSGERKSSKEPALPAVTQELLAALAPGTRTEPHLLRQLRLHLNERGADIGCEYEVWHHPGVVSDELACALRPEFRSEAAALFESLPVDLQATLVRVRCNGNRHLSPLIRLEEALVARPWLAAREVKEAQRESCRYGATLYKPDSRGIKRPLSAYISGLGRRRPELLAQSRELATAWAIARREELKAGTLDAIPAGVELADVQWLLSKEYQPRRACLAQIGDWIGLFPEEQAQPVCRFASLVLESPYWQIEPVTEGIEEDTAPQLLQIGESLALSPQRRYRLSLERKMPLELEAVHCPPWAVGMGRNSDELFVERANGRRLFWMPKGWMMVEHEAGSSRSMGFRLPHGFWWDEAEFRIWLEVGRCLPYPPWASAISVDQYGLHAAFQVNGVGQNMRWIPPGEFLMGSPEDEPERFSDETQHPVLLTQGFWLAETACTQALWQAVLDEDPSHFQGAERPVERVGWADIVERFLPALNRLVPGLEASLPSEAQWEYACRAGTTTPFWFGDNITPDQVNYDGNYPYAKGRKGQYREKTVEAKALPANGWGLYQMHGNVWEWCADWRGNYPEERVINPKGPIEGRERVLRGGSWFSGSRSCHSAVRSAFGPGFRDHTFGFRLVRGSFPHRAGSAVKGGVAAGGRS